MPTLTVHTVHDGLLSVIAPLGLAAAAGTCLMVDLDPQGPPYPGPGSLAGLVAEGPRRSDLVPARGGTAVLRNGGVTSAEAAPVLAALARGWPALVLRSPPTLDPGGAPVVPVRPLFPGLLAPVDPTPAVYQRTGFPGLPPGPGPVLPRPRPRVVAGLLAGVVEPRSRWVSAWREVWSGPW